MRRLVSSLLAAAALVVAPAAARAQTYRIDGCTDAPGYALSPIIPAGTAPRVCSGFIDFQDFGDAPPGVHFRVNLGNFGDVVSRRLTTIDDEVGVLGLSLVTNIVQPNGDFVRLYLEEVSGFTVDARPVIAAFGVPLSTFRPVAIEGFYLTQPRGSQPGTPQQTLGGFSYAVTTPEPSTYAMMGAGLLALGGVARKRRTGAVQA